MLVAALTLLLGQSLPDGAGGHGTLAERSFRSEALGVEKRYWVYLPQGYEKSSERFPVVYMLHGLGGGESDWFGGAGLARTADAVGLRAIIVTPDGDAGFYVNGRKPVDYEACMKARPPASTEPAWAYCVRRPHYEDYIVRDLVGHVDATYRTMARREARAIGGLSMGGFGAFVLAMRRSDVFSAAASHAGVLSLIDRPPRVRGPAVAATSANLSTWGQDLGWGWHVRDLFGPDIANWRAHDPVALTGALAPGRLALFLDCGTADEYHLADAATALHEVLRRRKVAHEFALVPGGRHDVPYWSARVKESLRFFAAHFAKALAGKRPPR